jgi:hypothetical protein
MTGLVTSNTAPRARPAVLTCRHCATCPPAHRQCSGQPGPGVISRRLSTVPGVPARQTSPPVTRHGPRRVDHRGAHRGARGARADARRQQTCGITGPRPQPSSTDSAHCRKRPVQRRTQIDTAVSHRTSTRASAGSRRQGSTTRLTTTRTRCPISQFSCRESLCHGSIRLL